VFSGNDVCEIGYVRVGEDMGEAKGDLFPIVKKEYLITQSAKTEQNKPSK